MGGGPLDRLPVRKENGTAAACGGLRSNQWEGSDVGDGRRSPGNVPKWAETKEKIIITDQMTPNPTLGGFRLRTGSGTSQRLLDVFNQSSSR